MNRHSRFIFASAIAAATVVAQSAVGESVPSEPENLEEVLVTGGKEAIETLTGSAHLLDEFALEQFDYADINQVLAALPGVYIRQEDGYGLRPNIGLRGVTSERSQKITLMEDGVLIKPAPYSAPSAYYVPNISRMSAVEVVKGSESIKFGPNNVGGAINLATQPVPSVSSGFVDVSLGNFGHQKYQAFYGNQFEHFGFWLDALHLASDGFKDLDGGGDTGFERNDINAKLQWQYDDLGGYEQLFTVKLGYADEQADETYLGLTQADFDADPYRRYAASQLALFDSEHTQIHAEHVIVFSDAFRLTTKAYFNEFDRAWEKLDGFIDGVPVATVLSRPDVFTREVGIIRGEIDSNNTASEILDVTTNDRSYGSHGIQLRADYEWVQGEIEHNIEVGVRFHHDYIERDHFTDGYLMQNGRLVSDGVDYGNKTLNEAETDALSAYVQDAIAWGSWTFNLGVRAESIDSETTDFLTDSRGDNSETIVAPGAGIFWQATDTLGFLVGVNKGFSPAGASAGDDVNPEESTNFEYGFRYNTGDFSAEVIGFFSDYDNLLGRCRASDSGCNVGEEFNGGRVEIAGVEIYSSYTHSLTNGLTLPVSLSYTYTESAFQESFTSSFSQWGVVAKGDELPYLPEQVARLLVGVSGTQWDVSLAMNYQSEMRDQAGVEDFSDVLHTDAYTTFDVSGSWQPNATWLLQLSVDNLTDEQAIVSWRPFGARPNKPRTVRARAKYSF